MYRQTPTSTTIILLNSKGYQKWMSLCTEIFRDDKVVIIRVCACNKCIKKELDMMHTKRNGLNYLMQ